MPAKIRDTSSHVQQLAAVSVVSLDPYTELREWYRRRPEAYFENLFFTGIVPGFDGSLLHDGDDVFVVNPHRKCDHLTMRKAYFWHGFVADRPICQMCGDESDYAADELISPCRGVTRSVSHISKNSGGAGLSRASSFRVAPSCIYTLH